MSDNSYPPRNHAQLYHPRGENSGEHPEVKRRMIVAFLECADEDKYEISELIEAEIGIDGPDRLNRDWVPYLENLNRKHFRSVFSVLAHHLRQYAASSQLEWYESRVEQLKISLNRIFSEECVLLTFGDDLIIHPKTDRAFELQRVNLIRGIEGEEYEAAREHLAATEKAFLAEPPDGATAIRSVFLLAENIFKQMSGLRSLNTSAAKAELSKIVAKIYSSRPHERQVAEKQIQGFLKWIEGAHFYRHDPGQPDVSQPSDEISALAVSEGFAFCRWLADLKRLNS